MSFKDIIELDFDEYKLLFRDAYIHKLQKTEQGREYLENCYILEQTQPNREKLRSKFNRE